MQLLITYDDQAEAEAAEKKLTGKKRLATDRDDNEVIYNLFGEPTWANFYQYVDYRAVVFRKVDGTVFWKMAHWLARKYRCRIKALLIKSFRSSGPGITKTWVRFDKVNGSVRFASLERLSGRPKGQFRWRSPEINPYLRSEERVTITSRYRDVATAMSHA